MFSDIPPHTGDPILGLLETFRTDPRPGKVNLGVGMYYDERGVIPVLDSIKQAEQRISSDTHARVYLPMEGDQAYRAAIAPLIFGDALASELMLSTIQTIGGSGALKVGADFLHRFFPDRSVWVPNPTWDNHIGIFEGAGFRIARYPYYDESTKGLAFEALLTSLTATEPGDIVLLHPCCHNPTGVDPSRAQWSAIVDLLDERKLLPFFDMAYQGFDKSNDDDAWVIRECAARGVDLLVSLSFSKTFSLYGERCGALSVTSRNQTTADNVLGQLKLAVRRNYSSPPTHGMKLITTVLSDSALRETWCRELDAMRARIHEVRSQLRQMLLELRPSGSYDYLVQQTGMFAYTGLSNAQVNALKDEYGVYAVGSGRICVAGLNADNLIRVARAISSVENAVAA
ncbi:amino acid aminotransferase [Paraburkholderia fungorum]|uniref:amino acid aminotransferase n=1 Tax=Paraburkholderia fungorum TaxID=134537 RepID=UPI0033131B94